MAWNDLYSWNNGLFFASKPAGTTRLVQLLLLHAAVLGKLRITFRPLSSRSELKQLAYRFRSRALQVRGSPTSFCDVSCYETVNPPIVIRRKFWGPVYQKILQEVISAVCDQSGGNFGEGKRSWGIGRLTRVKCRKRKAVRFVKQLEWASIRNWIWVKV